MGKLWNFERRASKRRILGKDTKHHSICVGKGEDLPRDREPVVQDPGSEEIRVAQPAQEDDKFSSPGPRLQNNNRKTALVNRHLPGE